MLEIGFSGISPEHYNEIAAGSLVEVTSFNRSADYESEDVIKTHRVYKDREGARYVEIFENPKKQFFLSRLCRSLNVTPVYLYSPKVGEEIYLSLYPNRANVDYRPAGKIVGFAKEIVLNAIFGTDIYLKSMADTPRFRSKAHHNLNIINGNMLFYDMGKCTINRLVTEAEISTRIQLSLSEIESAFTADEHFSALNSLENFRHLVLIEAEREVRQMIERVRKLNTKGINELLRESKVGDLSEIFPALGSEYLVMDFYNVLCRQLELVHSEIYKRMV